MLGRILKFSTQQCPFFRTKLHYRFISLTKTNYFVHKHFSFINDEKNVTDGKIIENEDDPLEVIVEDNESIPKNPKSYTQQEKDMVFIEECNISKIGQKILIKSSYGVFELRGSLIPPNKIEQIKTLYYVNDNVSINYIRKVLKSDPQCLLVFDPTSHLANAIATYNGYKKKLSTQFYGNKKHPKNPYKNCKNNADIFNLSRRIKMQLKAFLTRICFIVDYDGDLRIKGENVPRSETLINILRGNNNKIESSENTKIGFYKHHYLVPISYWQGLNSSDEWEKSGIQISALGDKKIYPLYSVWSPTSQNYLSLLDNYLQEKVNMIKSRKNVLEIGCGTGVLSFMTVQKTGSKDVYCIDSNPKAVECTAMNAQILDMADSITVGVLDVVDTIKENKTEKHLKDLKFPLKYELIIANPPWITASLLNSEHTLDNAIYDPDEIFLKAIFAFASKHLTTYSTIAKNGILLLYYSDLSQILTLQPKDRIEQLCTEHNLTITKTETSKFIDEFQVGSSEYDPLVNFKNQAKVILYEITRL